MVVSRTLHDFQASAVKQQPWHWSGVSRRGSKRLLWLHNLPPQQLQTFPQLRWMQQAILVCHGTTACKFCVESALSFLRGF